MMRLQDLAVLWGVTLILAVVARIARERPEGYYCRIFTILSALASACATGLWIRGGCIVAAEATATSVQASSMMPYFNAFFTYAALSAALIFVARRDLTLTILVPSSLMLVNYVLQLAIPALPHTFDAQLWRIDESLGFSPSLVMVYLFLFTPALQVLSGFFYQGLPLLFGALVWRYEEAEPILKRLGVAAVVGFALYFILPAQGPAWLMVGRNDMPRNAIPSLHLTWALLIAWNAARWGRWARLGGFALALFTALATLGFGEHYLIDLIVAVFFAASIELGFQRRVRDSSIFAVVTLYLIVSIRLWSQGIIQ